MRAWKTTCKYDEYKTYMWLKVTLCEDKLNVACYIPHRESNYYNLYELHHDYPFSNVCDYILTYEKIGKVLVMIDFRVGTYQNIEVDNNVMVLDLTPDSEDCVVSNYGRLLTHG